MGQTHHIAPRAARHVVTRTDGTGPGASTGAGDGTDGVARPEEMAHPRTHLLHLLSSTMQYNFCQDIVFLQKYLKRTHHPQMQIMHYYYLLLQWMHLNLCFYQILVQNQIVNGLVHNL